ncbi:MAG: PepSY-associated TM helix domain-containing protein, partial [Parasphingopyxis sp.]
WPARMTRPAILRHHRDLGILLAPLLLLSMLTGTAMVLRPVADYLLAPLSPPGSIERALAPPDAPGGPIAADPDWSAMFATAKQNFPGTRLRVLSIPQSGLIQLRTRQPAEWLPQGRSTLWFDAASGELVEARDALAMEPAAQAFNMAYPLHAAKVGGLAYRLVMSLSGIALILLGSLAVWSFWFRRNEKRPVSRSARPLPAAR